MSRHQILHSCKDAPPIPQSHHMPTAGPTS